MNDNDMNNMMNQLNNMIQNPKFSDDIKKIFNNFKDSSDNANTTDNSSNSKDESISDNPEIDINTILKLKKVMDSMNSKKDDPRSRLLLSLKPYLKESRRKKVDQYIQLFGLGKAFEIMNSLGGDQDAK